MNYYLSISAYPKNKNGSWSRIATRRCYNIGDGNVDLFSETEKYCEDIVKTCLAHNPDTREVCIEAFKTLDGMPKERVEPFVVSARPFKKIDVIIRRPL